MKPHVLFICSEYPPSAGGGIGTFYKTLAQALAQEGWRVTVGGIYGDVTERTVTDEENVRIWRLPASRNTRGRYHLNMLLDRWRLGRWAQYMIRSENVVLVDGADYMGWLWAIPKLVPMITRIHGADILFRPLLGQKPMPLKAYLERQSIHRTDYIISSSEFMSRQLGPLLNKNQKIDRTIYNMVDTDNFSPDTTVQRDHNTVVSLASITRKKGIYQLLEAWRKVHRVAPEAKLIYYGRDMPDTEVSSNVEALKSLAQAYGIASSVSFAGQVPYDSLKQVFHQGGVFVFPSYVEAHPRAWLEAMSTGAAVIGSTRGPGPEVIRDGETGYLIDPDDTEALADRILQLLEKPEIGKRMGENARQDMVDHYSIRVIMETNMAFYEECLRAK